MSTHSQDPYSRKRKSAQYQDSLDREAEQDYHSHKCPRLSLIPHSRKRKTEQDYHSQDPHSRKRKTEQDHHSQDYHSSKREASKDDRSQYYHSRKREASKDDRSQYYHSSKRARLSFTAPQPQNAEAAAAAAEAAAVAKAAVAKAAAEKAAAEKAAAEKAAAEKAAAEKAAAKKTAAAEKAAAKKAAAAEKAAADKYILWLFNTRAGQYVFKGLTKKEQKSFWTSYKTARAEAVSKAALEEALREKASRKRFTTVVKTSTHCRYCFEPIMIGKRTDNTNAFWCQKHCNKK